MKITRREFALGTFAFGTAALALGGAVAALSRFPQTGFDFVRPARADDPALADLMAPNPLGEMAMGDEKAPITVIEYASMTCPHCAHFSETTFPELKKRYIDTGKVRFIFREFPLDQLAAAGPVLAAGGSPAKASQRALSRVAWRRPAVPGPGAASRPGSPASSLQSAPG